MISKQITDSDAFLDMPCSTQCLYFHLLQRADDDGFVGCPKKIQRCIGASEDDLKLLIAKSFLIPFESGIVVIKHWRIHNYLRSDRYKPTAYTEEKQQLQLKDNGAYTIGIPDGNQLVYQVDTQVKLSKDKLSQDKLSNSNKRFVKPTLEEVSAYCKERKNNVDPEQFIDYYEANGWRVGKNPMKDWKASVRTWEKSEYRKTNNKTLEVERSYDLDEISELQNTKRIKYERKS